MDVISCIFFLLIIVILGLFIRFLIRLYKDRGRLAFQVISIIVIIKQLKYLMDLFYKFVSDHWELKLDEHALLLEYFLCLKDPHCDFKNYQNHH